MKTISFLTFLAGIVATYAAPAPAAGTSDINAALNPLAPNLEKRADVGVFFCTDVNFTGTCAKVTGPPDVCAEIDPPFEDQISSVGPDRPWKCGFYVAPGCGLQEGFFDIESPGISDLRLAGFNDKISSFRCSA